MSGSPSLMYPVTPLKPHNTSALASGSSPSPVRSSPLNPSYRHQHPPSQRRASMHNEFRVQSRYIRPPAPSSAFTSSPAVNGDEYQKALRRERFRKTCAERAERDRVKFRDAARARGRSSTSSAHSATSDDMEMEMDEDEDEEAEGMNDPLYGIFMMDERRRARYAQRVSFQQAVGSSLDPDMDGFEEYERHFTNTTAAGATPQYYEEEEYDVPPDSEQEVEFAMLNNIPSDSPLERHPNDDTDVDIEMPLSSPPPSPRPTHLPSLSTSMMADSSFTSLLLECPCPSCSAPYSLYLDAVQMNDQPTQSMTCAVCTEAFHLGNAQQSWEAVHPAPIPGHAPLAMIDPSLSEGVIIMCSDDMCPWGASL